MKIVGFKDKNFFLSNFYNQKVHFNGLVYKNNVSAYIAQMFENQSQQILFTRLLPMQAIRLYERTNLHNEDWDKKKEEIMYNLCKEKFSIEFLKNKLLATGDSELINETSWENSFWGTNSKGEGKNTLGKILMRIRKELSEEKNKDKKEKEDSANLAIITEEVKQEANKKQGKKK